VAGLAFGPNFSRWWRTSSPVRSLAGSSFAVACRPNKKIAFKNRGDQRHCHALFRLQPAQQHGTACARNLVQPVASEPLSDIAPFIDVG